MRDVIEDFTITGIETTPAVVGQIITSTVQEIPEGWLPCDGRMLRRDSYPELYKVLGVKYGDGDGSNIAFNLPNIASPSPDSHYIIFVDVQNS
jgi:microcystin-dependent protein